jgi:hypothetical protein
VLFLVSSLNVVKEYTRKRGSIKYVPYFFVALKNDVGVNAAYAARFLGCVTLR